MEIILAHVHEWRRDHVDQRSDDCNTGRTLGRRRGHPPNLVLDGRVSVRSKGLIYGRAAGARSTHGCVIERVSQQIPLPFAAGLLNSSLGTRVFHAMRVSRAARRVRNKTADVHECQFGRT